MDNIVLSGRYSLLEKISEGGMSTIYKAYCNVLNRIVAVKILKQEFSNDEEFLAKFNNEAKSAASLNHPNIVGIYDVGSDDDISYIVMEYVDGKNIKQFIKQRGRFAEEGALDIIKQICLALKEAHDNNIVHRDIKPHNIMINKNGIVKVGDFGIAKATSSSTLIASDNIMGSVHYISPEQAKGSYVDKRSDIYSLGVVFYEMLIGKVPFDSEKPIDVALKHINENITILEEYKNIISESVQNIILKMTQKNVNNRYYDVSQIINDIETLQNTNETISFSNINDNEQTKIIKTSKKEIIKSKKNKKSKFSIILLIISLIILFSLGYFILSSKYLNSVTGKHNVLIPDIKGKKVEDARKELENIGLKLNIISEKDSLDEEDGVILEQNPDSNIKILKGEEISVIVSKTPKDLVILSDVVQKRLDDAKKILESNNLKVKVRYEHSETIEKNIVVYQNPSSNSKLRYGDEVILLVSNGKKEETEEVPNFVGVMLEDVEKIKGNFKIGSINYKEDENKENGVVLEQSPAKGNTQKKGSTVDIVVNKISKKVQDNSSQSEVNDLTKNKFEKISKSITISLPKKDSILLTLVDRSTGSVAFTSTVSSIETQTFNVYLEGYVGELKQYDVYVNGEYYATTGSVSF